MATRSVQPAIASLRHALPWTLSPLIVQAPMRILSGPALAVACSEAGGLGFLGPGEKPEHLRDELNASRKLVEQSSKLKQYLADTSKAVLPIGFGIQTWAGDLKITHEVLKEVAHTHPPCVAWLFVPRNGQKELDEWTATIRSVSPRTKIWIQFASVADALSAARSAHAPDVLVIQGTDAGGHSKVQGAGIISLLPEIADALENEQLPQIPLIAAGGIADARGTAAAMVLGASGVAMGTRFLLTKEARIKSGYQNAILEASDGGQTTVRTQLYNHLRGTTDWPAEYDARGLVNASWRDHKAGVSFDDNKSLHGEALKKGDAAWGRVSGRTATYAGTNVGLIKNIRSASDIIIDTRDGARRLLEKASSLINQ